MTQALHILGKDLRRLRWSLIGWLALIVARMLIDTAGADVALSGFGPLVAIAQMSVLLTAMYVLFLAVLVSRLVHEDPAIGRDAFWITRPVAPSALVSAKLAAAALFLVAVPVASDVAVAAAFGTHGRQLADVLPVALINHTAIVAVLMALAAVTPSLARFVLTMLGVIAAFVALSASQLLFALFTQEIGEGSGEFVPPDPTPAVIGGLLVVLTAIVIVIYQYRARRLARTLAIAAVGAVLVFVVPPRWPWSFAAQPRAESAPPPADTPLMSVSLGSGTPRVSEPFVLRSRGPARKQIAVQATVSGVPPAFTVHTAVARSRLELPGGVTLQSDRRAGGSVRMTNSFTAGVGAAIEAALGGVRLLTKTNDIEAPLAEMWPELLRVDEADFVRHKSEPGRLSAELRLFFEKPVIRAALPLADGAAQDVDAARIAIVRVVRRATGCTVLLRRSEVERLFSARGFHQLTYVLRNAARGEAVGADFNHLTEGGLGIGAFYFSPPRIGGRGFQLDQYDLEFPERRRGGTSIDLDEAWVRGAELVVLEMISAGVITRTVSIDRFQMAP